MIGNIISHFKILEKLGAGGMGEIYVAEDTQLDRKVALKFLSVHYAADSEAVERFKREAKAAAALNHPNIITVYEVGEHEGQIFIAMEYVDGESLRDKIRGGQLPSALFLDLAGQICTGLCKAHEAGIVHRDLKPENIVLDKDGRARILDFGLAKLKGATKLTKESSTLGTLHYMSPEQLQAMEVDHRTDIWSMGAILYEMVTGELPFQGEYEAAVLYSVLSEEPESVASLRDNVPAELQAVITKALTKNLDMRYQQVDHMLTDLQGVAAEGSAGTGRIAAWPTTGEKKRAKTQLWLASLLGITLLVIGYFVLQRLQPETPPWLQKETSLTRLTSELGDQRGRISPDGNYVAYQDGNGNIKLKTLKTGEVKTVAESEGATHLQPVWAPDGQQFAFTQWENGAILVCNLLGNITHRLDANGTAFFPAWSSDGLGIVYLLEKGMDFFLVIKRMDGNEERTINMKTFPFFPTWIPDSRKIAIITIKDSPYAARGDIGNIRLLDVDTGVLSDTLEYAQPYFRNWWTGGLTWSPDGRFLVYVAYDGDNRELFALPMNPTDYSVTGEPVRVTRFGGNGAPLWPAFSRDGRRLSFVLDEQNADIYVLPFDLESTTITGEPIPVALDRRKDVQPSWTPNSKEVVFASARDGQFELYCFNLDSRETRRLTFSERREVNPQISADGKTISFFADGAIWGMSAKGGEAIRLTPPTIKHQSRFLCLPNGRGFLVTATDIAGLNLSQLLHISSDGRRQKTLLRKLVLPDFTLASDGQRLAISGYVESLHSRTEDIILYDLETEKWHVLLNKPGLHPRGLMSWTADGRFVLHERWVRDRGRIFELIPADGGEPREVFLNVDKLDGDIFLGPISPDGKNILLIVMKEESDIWVLGPEERK